MLVGCTADLSLCSSTGKVTILAVRVGVPAWLRAQTQVRGSGACAGWGWGLEEGGWG